MSRKSSYLRSLGKVDNLNHKERQTRKVKPANSSPLDYMEKKHKMGKRKKKICTMSKFEVLPKFAKYHFI